MAARAFIWKAKGSQPPAALAAFFLRADTETGLHASAEQAADAHYARLRGYVRSGGAEATPLGLDLLERHAKKD